MVLHILFQTVILRLSRLARILLLSLDGTMERQHTELALLIW